VWPADKVVPAPIVVPVIIPPPSVPIGAYGCAPSAALDVNAIDWLDPGLGKPRPLDQMCQIAAIINPVHPGILASER